MKRYSKSLIATAKRNKTDQGFTLVEVIISGLVMGGMMVSVAQLAGKAMIGSNNQKDRQTIEAAINNDIQLLQQADSQLTYQWIVENGNSANACADPGQYLATLLDEAGGPFEVKPSNTIGGEKTKKLFERTISGAALTGLSASNSHVLTQIVYSFEGPEQTIGNEKRIVKLSPSFQANCYG
jgi:type II secretory pathway pseudopilin PulG